MKCTTSEMDIEVVYNRVKNNDINLQPDFQRGEVWSHHKKKKLIDSILRGWKIPPIHVVDSKDAIDEVLDGQQRLRTIVDFLDNKISIDGNIEPSDKYIASLNGFKYSDLDLATQRTFKKYSITIIRLTEYAPDEPAELFYRLNQPISLTSAEQRNAFIGTTRQEIKDLVDKFIELGADKDTIGFSNSRLAYDEVISKFCYTMELKTLKKKITSSEISEKYRNDVSFSSESLRDCSYVIDIFMNSILEYRNGLGTHKILFNKATLFSWFVYIKQNLNTTKPATISKIIYDFESYRLYLKGKLKTTFFEDFSEQYNQLQNNYPYFEVMLSTFNQRASMGSTDALSIIYRDIIIHIFSSMLHHTSLSSDAKQYFSEQNNFPNTLEIISRKYDWGRTF